MYDVFQNCFHSMALLIRCRAACIHVVDPLYPPLACGSGSTIKIIGENINLKEYIQYIHNVVVCVLLIFA
jgi:hypothetical protein